YIRIVGTHNTVNKVFHIVAFECMFTNKTFTLEKGLIVPTENVATIADCASVIEGVSRSRNALLNGDTKNYDWDSGYTCHQLGSGAIVVQLAQPYMIGSIRLLLWDCDDRSYSYYIEVSTNQQQWTMVADRTKISCKSWQTITFDKQPASFIRIVGTHNTANEVFHCVHFECPAQSGTHKDEGSKEVATTEVGTGGQQLVSRPVRAASTSSLHSPPGSTSRSHAHQP
ncbi:PREDICTED: BTB/POZ domain-containing protein 9-like, partial [Leptosomus discolor]|uniref:BTB/POZ domain-containing protein 9-like n=1 Tax=Leptosomus discolor TaxID=188344 RepID=UPI0005228880